MAGLPLVVKPIQAALGGSARQLAETAYVLGKGPLETYVRVLLPHHPAATWPRACSWPWAGPWGEVGITLMLGGDIIGKTNTLSLEIYNAVFSGEFDRALVLSAIIGVISMGLFLVLRRLSAV